MLSWQIQEGDLLTEGQQVGLVDTTQLYLQREALMKSGKAVTAARPNVGTQTRALEVQIEDLRDQRERVATLLSAGAATQKELDDIETGINSLESQLTASRSTLQNSNAQISAQSSSIDVQIAQVEDMMARSIIKAPISGTVTANYIHQSELTGQGRPLFRIANLDEIYLRAYIANSQLSSIQLGENVTVRVDGKDGDKREYEGVVSWIASESEFTPKTVQTEDERANLVYAVKVRVKNDGFLRIGMYGEVLKK